MKYTDLSDKERYEVIKLGVQNGMTNLNDIEKAYNEFANGGSLKQDDYYNNVVLQKDDEQKQQIKEQLEERRTYTDGGKINEIQSLFKSNPIEAKKMWDSLSDDDKKAYGVEGGFWNVVSNISHKFGDGSNIYGYSENDDALTLYKDVDDIYVTPNGNYYEGDEYNKRKQKDIMSDINNNPALLFNPEYNDWYNYYRGLSKKEGWDFDSQMSEIFNRLPFEEQEWVIQNNPSAFNLLPQDVKSDYITKTKVIRPGTFQRLVDDAGDGFLEKSVNNATIAAGLISLPTARNFAYSNVGMNIMKNYVMPPLTAYWGAEGAKDLIVNDPFGKAVDEVKNKDYYGAAADAIHGAFDASMVLPAAGFFGKAGKGIYDSSSKAVQSVKNKAKDFTLKVPEDPNRYYRIVGETGNPIGDAIESGVIRGPGANPNAEGLFKAHNYPMFAKGRPWEGSTAKQSGGKPIIIRSKENTGPIKWEESNVDFTHKGHNGIFRPNFYGDINAAPSQFFEYYEPKLIGYMRKDFPKSNNPYSNFMGNGYKVNRGNWEESSLGVKGKDFGEYIGSGSEQAVFNNKSNPETVLKVYEDTYRTKLDEVKQLVSDFENRRNNIPLQEQIKFVGLIDNNGNPYPVFQQNKLLPLKSFDKKSILQLQKELEKYGYKGDLKNKGFSNGQKTLSDLKPENVGYDSNGNLKFIDVDSY